MFFKWPGKNKAPASVEPTSTAETESPDNKKAREGGSTSTPPLRNALEPLACDELRRAVDAKALGFKTTADLEPASGLIGQDRALRAISFGVGIKAPDFNLFVLGPPASGKSTAVRSYLSKEACAAATPPDWVYVNNFEDPNRPKALQLPAGRANRLKQGMIDAISELAITLPQAFEGEDYQARRRAIEEEFRSGQDEVVEALSEKAASQNIALLRTPLGFAMAPMHEGKVVKPEVFNQLPDSMRREVEARVGVLQKELEAALAHAPKADKLRRKHISALNDEIAMAVVEAALDEVSAEFSDLAEVARHLAAVETDLVHNAALFLADSTEHGAAMRPLADPTRDQRFRRYLINVMVAHEESAGAPICEELNPTLGNLVGRVEHIAQMGALVTDFLLIKPGALHRANGGYLLIDARKALTSPLAWEALKRALKAQQISIEHPAETLGIGATQTLEPDPIPLDLKVILLGERDIYYQLCEHDPDFPRLFKVQADFDDTIRRTKENDEAYARLIASVVATHKLKPVEAAGVARLIEEGARLAEDSERLTIEIGRLADIVREADYWAGLEKREVIGRRDIARAIDEHVQRADRMRDRTQEGFERGIVLVDTEGVKPGQVNGLAMLQAGDFSFGRPARITARVHLGQGRVTDIEREAKLGGPLHSKGVMILWGFLAGRFAQDVPLALAATLVFEQSYGAVEGDSASAAELFALLSALADLPLRQDLAITGSVNQWGEVQAIGGVNQKIEGFYDVCQARGLTGKQGVIIPRANTQHLMLREDVVESVREKWFSVYAISTVDEGIELLTGVKAGERGADGKYPPETVNGRVEARLTAFAEKARAFSVTKENAGKAQAGTA